MKGKICIVDHDLASRGFLRECLEREGYDVSVLDNAFELSPLLTKVFFNIFILNVDAPGIRQRNLLIELNKFKPARILLVVTERGDPFLKEAIELGVYLFIYKPFNRAEICTMVSHLIR